MKGIVIFRLKYVLCVVATVSTLVVFMHMYFGYNLLYTGTPGGGDITIESHQNVHKLRGKSTNPQEGIADGRPIKSPPLSFRNDNEPKRPNIVFIMADDMGYNDVGYHNKEGVYTPTIDKLASQGVTLENYYVQPICSPSRIQFMSARKLTHTGIVHDVMKLRQPFGLPCDSLTLADKFKDAGYATDMVGKWHLGFFEEKYVPTQRGFDTFYGYYAGRSDHYTHKRCFKQGCKLDLHNDTTSERKIDRGQGGTYSTHLYTDEAIRVIKHRSKGTDPFFLFLSYQAVHDPIQVPDKYIKEVKTKIRSDNVKGKGRMGYVGMAYAMDCGIARVVESLKETGVWNNTILIFASDNGGYKKHGGSNLPLKGEKFTYYEGGIRAVSFVNSPLIDKTGYVNNELIHISDWFSTFMTLAKGNLRGTQELDSFNQWDTISHGTPSPRKEIFFNIDPLSKSKFRPVFKHEFDTRWLAALRIGDYKIITGLNKSPGLVLYNVKKDPLEQNDLSKDDGFKSKVMEMLDALQVYKNTSVTPLNPEVGKFKADVVAIEPGILI